MQFIHVDISSIANGKTMIPMINRTAPVYDVRVEKKILLQLIQQPKLIIKVSGTNTRVTGGNIIELFDSSLTLDSSSHVSPACCVCFSNGNYSAIKVKTVSDKVIYPITGSLVATLSNNDSLLVSFTAIEISKEEIKLIGTNNSKDYTLAYKIKSTDDEYSYYRWNLSYTANSINGFIIAPADVLNETRLEFIMQIPR